MHPSLPADEGRTPAGNAIPRQEARATYVFVGWAGAETAQAARSLVDVGWRGVHVVADDRVGACRDLLPADVDVIGASRLCGPAGWAGLDGADDLDIRLLRLHLDDPVAADLGQREEALPRSWIVALSGARGPVETLAVRLAARGFRQLREASHPSVLVAAERVDRVHPLLVDPVGALQIATAVLVHEAGAEPPTSVPGLLPAGPAVDAAEIEAPALDDAAPVPTEEMQASQTIGMRGSLGRAAALSMRKVKTAVLVARLDRRSFWWLLQRNLGLVRRPEVGASLPAMRFPPAAPDMSPPRSIADDAVTARSADPRDSLVTGIRRGLSKPRQTAT